MTLLPIAESEELCEKICAVICISYPLNVLWALSLFNSQYFIQSSFQPQPKSFSDKFPLLFVYSDGDQVSLFLLFPFKHVLQHIVHACVLSVL